MSVPSKAEARHHRAFPEECWRTAARCAWQQCWMGSSSSHISGGHWNKALANTHVLRQGHGAKFLSSTGMLPLCKCRGVSTLGLSPRIVDLSSCGARLDALSTAGCECSLPDGKRSLEKMFGTNCLENIFGKQTKNVCFFVGGGTKTIWKHLFWNSCFWKTLF